MAEGHYCYVNKNLIEMLACLVLASTPNGLWIGLDALLSVGCGRPWLVRAANAAVAASATIPSTIRASSGRYRHRTRPVGSPHPLI